MKRDLNDPTPLHPLCAHTCKRNGHSVEAREREREGRKQRVKMSSSAVAAREKCSWKDDAVVGSCAVAVGEPVKFLF